jgi:hypothetical protein
MNFIGIISIVAIIIVSSGCGNVGKKFNTSKIENIINGTTTQSDIKKLLGKPFKTGIQNGYSIWIYEDHHYSIIRKDQSKDLIITFDPNGIVKSYQFMSSELAL